MTWEIAIDLSAHKVNGDRLIDPKQPYVRQWYLDHPEAWRVVKVCAIARVTHIT